MHVVHGALTASYRKPGEIGWWLTLLVLGLAVAEGITGGLLPWDQLGWWARVVEGNIAGLAPVIGGFVQQMIAGGSELGALGLARAFTIHVMLLPPLIALASSGAAAFAAGRAPGPSAAASDPAGAHARRAQRVRRRAGALRVESSRSRAVAHGAPLDAPADPRRLSGAARAWFLDADVPACAHFFHGAMEFWGTSLVPGAAAGFLVMLPFLDRPGRSRALVVGGVIAIFGGAIVLGLVAHSHDAHDAQYRKQRAKADAKATAAIALAMNGVPPAGPLAMVNSDPELRGRDLFDKHCASCHVLGDLGDAEKATATKLDGWGTPAWIEAMIHDPDAPEFFGRGPYKEAMPSVDTRPKDKPAGEAWSPMVKTAAEKTAVALFLSSLGDEADDPPRAIDPAVRALGEKIVSERCSTCHLYKGDGDDQGSGVAPEVVGFGSIAWTHAQVANPATATTYRDKALDPAMKKHMPRFDGDLSPADVDVVARWTRSHARAAAFVAR